MYAVLNRLYDNAELPGCGVVEQAPLEHETATGMVSSTDSQPRAWYAVVNQPTLSTRLPFYVPDPRDIVAVVTWCGSSSNEHLSID